MSALLSQLEGRERRAECLRNEAEIAGNADTARPLGCALAMRVWQSALYAQLDDTERADCDELVQRNLEWFARDSASPALRAFFAECEAEARQIVRQG